MSELRFDPLAGRWTVLAKERADRPKDLPGGRTGLAGATCPFCPGQEFQTPPELLRIGDPTWRVRVVPNKFAAFAATTAPATPEPGLWRSRPSVGAAEVVIETPVHDQHFDAYSLEQATDVIRAYQIRCGALSEAGFDELLVFRNCGPGSGASLEHPHSQILASKHTLPVMDAERTALYADSGHCLICRMANQEAHQGRAVIDMGDFLALTPYASRSPFELLVIPCRHAPDFRQAEPGALAQVLRELLGRIRHRLGDPPTNFWIHSSRQDFHWHLHLLPRLHVDGGWELGSGLAINSKDPDEAAAVLRA